MSSYQLYVFLHAVREVLQWVVPLLAVITVCVTVVILSNRSVRRGRDASGASAEINRRISALERRLDAIEQRMRHGA